MPSELTLHVVALAGFALDTPQMIGLELRIQSTTSLRPHYTSGPSRLPCADQVEVRKFLTIPLATRIAYSSIQEI